MKHAATTTVLIAFLILGAGALAQVRPGAPVEKTYGVGLPRDWEKLAIDDRDYPEFPLKPGQEAYRDVDGYRIKDLIKKFTAISLKSLDDGEQYWGRIAGTRYDRMTTELMAEEFGRLGLTVTRQPFAIGHLWYPTHWSASYTASGKTGRLSTLFPINETRPTGPGGLTADAVWVGVGAAADLLGRDVKGKAVIVYSTLVPGGRSHSASDRAGIFNADTLATRAGAAMIINVMAVPGNGLFNPEGAPAGPGAVPTLTISQDEGFLLRDLLATGERVTIHLTLDIEDRTDLPSQNVYAVLPGASEEEVVVMAHTDGFFQGAMDNASGMATAIDIARHYAALPRTERRRTMVFIATPDHHHGETGRDLMIRTRDWSRVAVVLNAEHTSQTLFYMYNADVMTSNAVSARRWFASGSPAFQQLVRNTLRDFNVSVYAVPEMRAGGSLGAVSPYAPSFHIIDHVIYHTTLDAPEFVPAVGLMYSERAFLKIIDDTNRMTLAEIRGTEKLPNPIR